MNGDSVTPPPSLATAHALSQPAVHASSSSPSAAAAAASSLCLQTSVQSANGVHHQHHHHHHHHHQQHQANQQHSVQHQHQQQHQQQQQPQLYYHSPQYQPDPPPPHLYYATHSSTALPCVPSLPTSLSFSPLHTSSIQSSLPPPLFQQQHLFHHQHHPSQHPSLHVSLQHRSASDSNRILGAPTTTTGGGGGSTVATPTGSGVGSGGGGGGGSSVPLPPTISVPPSRIERPPSARRVDSDSDDDDVDMPASQNRDYFEGDVQTFSNAQSLASTPATSSRSSFHTDPSTSHAAHLHHAPFAAPSHTSSHAPNACFSRVSASADAIASLDVDAELQKLKLGTTPHLGSAFSPVVVRSSSSSSSISSSQSSLKQASSSSFTSDFPTSYLCCDDNSQTLSSSCVPSDQTQHEQPSQQVQAPAKAEFIQFPPSLPLQQETRPLQQQKQQPQQQYQSVRSAGSLHRNFLYATALSGNSPAAIHAFSSRSFTPSFLVRASSTSSTSSVAAPSSSSSSNISSPIISRKNGSQNHSRARPSSANASKLQQLHLALVQAKLKEMSLEVSQLTQRIKQYEEDESSRALRYVRRALIVHNILLGTSIALTRFWFTIIHRRPYDGWLSRLLLGRIALDGSAPLSTLLASGAVGGMSSSLLNWMSVCYQLRSVSWKRNFAFFLSVANSIRILYRMHRASAHTPSHSLSTAIATGTASEEVLLIYSRARTAHWINIFLNVLYVVLRYIYLHGLVSFHGVTIL